MSTRNDVMDNLEDETRFIMVDGKLVSVRAVIDRILGDEKENKRKLSTG